MPVYDTICSKCDYKSSETIRMAELSGWDLAAICPSCHAELGSYHRIVSCPPARGSSHLKGRGDRRSTREPLNHAQQEQIGMAKEHAARGTFEGFT